MRDLKRLLIVRYTLLVAAVLIAISLLVIIPIRSNTLAREIDVLKVHAELFAREFERFYVEGTPYPEVDSYLEALSGDLSIRLTLIDTRGEVLGDSQFPADEMENHLSRSEVVAALEGDVESSVRESRTLGKDFIYVAAPVRVDGEIVGVVRAALAEEDFTPLVMQVWWIILIAFGILLVVIIAVSVWTERTIMRDLHVLREAVAAFAEGDLTHRVAEPRIKDFAELARGFNDMVERIRGMVEEASAERGKLEAVLDNVSAGVMVTDSESRIILVNPAAESILGVEAGKALGKHVIEAFSSSGLDIDVSRAVAGEDVEDEIELVYPRKAALKVKSNPVTASDGSVLATVSAIEDVTALKHLDHVRRDFVANVSHELRTPVATIKALTDSLMAGAWKEEETGEKFLRDLDHEVNRLSQLIEDLLALSRLESKERELNLEHMDIPELIRECLRSKHKLAEDYGITLETGGPLPETLFTGDYGLLRTALGNLMDNGMKYNRRGGKVVVTCRSEGGDLVIEVADDGIGISREDLGRVFERFYRVDRARSRETGGTGLGLSIVKHIVELHGGTVAVESVEDEGSTFTLRFPAGYRS